MKRLAAVLLGLPVLIGVGLLLPLTMMATMAGSQRPVDAAPVSSCTVETAGVTIDELDDQQIENAGIIISVGQGLGVSDWGLTIAIATAYQESKLYNLDYGDRDSLGLFQQRPSTGWGTPAQIMNPEYAARAFFGGPDSPTPNPGLLDIPAWEEMDLWVAAQSVQLSAFPTAYAQWEGLATEVVTTLAGGESTCTPLATGPWAIPLTGDYALTSSFGPRTHPITGEIDFHTGQDFGAASGTPVVAASAGVVTWAAYDGGYGNLVRVEHSDGIETYYAHLSDFTISVGDSVDAGQRIGSVGSTGNSTGPHLHFEVRLRAEPVDPMAFLEEKGLSP